MSEVKQQEVEVNQALYRAKGFWEKNSKLITIVSAAVVLIVGGYLAYKYFYVQPREVKAVEAIAPAQRNFSKDSLRLALNGDGRNAGFLKVIKNYGGTKSGNLAHLYAGICYLHMSDFNNAVRHLKDFDPNGSKPTEALVHGLLGDAYSELKKNNEAVEQYRKAGSTFEADANMSAEYLFRAAQLYEIMGKPKEAIEVLRKIKDRYPRSNKASLVEKYLGKLGDTEH